MRTIGKEKIMKLFWLPHKKVGEKRNFFNKKFEIKDNRRFKL